MHDAWCWFDNVPHPRGTRHSACSRHTCSATHTETDRSGVTERGQTRRSVPVPTGPRALPSTFAYRCGCCSVGHGCCCLLFAVGGWNNDRLGQHGARAEPDRPTRRDETSSQETTKKEQQAQGGEHGGDRNGRQTRRYTRPLMTCCAVPCKGDLRVSP
jgi:hypothetical protein